MKKKNGTLTKQRREFEMLLLQLHKDVRELSDQYNNSVAQLLKEFEQDTEPLFQSVLEEQTKQETAIIQVEHNQAEYPEVMTLSQVAEFLHLSKVTVRKYGVPCVKLDGHKAVMYRKDVVLHWMLNNQHWGNDQ